MFRSKGLVFAAMLLFAAIVTVMAPAADAADVTPHGHSCAAAPEIKLDEGVTTALDAVNDHAYFKIVLPQRGLLDVWADPGSLDIWSMQLLNDSCVPIPAINGGVSVLSGNYSRLTVPSTDLISNQTVSTLPGGTYFVRIDPEPVDVFGDKFTVHTKFRAHFGHDCTSAEPMPSTGSVKGELLYPTDREVFRLEMDEPGQIQAMAVMAGGNPPQLDLGLSDCSSLIRLSTVSEGAEKGKLTVISGTLDPGVYFLSVTPSGDKNLGAFVLTVGFVAEETPILNPETLGGGW